MAVSGKGAFIADGTDIVMGPPEPKAEAGVPAVVVPPPAVPLPAAPKPDRRPWLWVASGLLAAALVGLWYFQPWVPRATVVVVETVTTGPVARVLAVNGRIAAVQSVEVRPQVSGTLTEVLVDEGDTVSPNQPVTRLDAAAQQAFVRQAAAGLDAALVAQDDAKATYARAGALGPNAARIVLESAARAAETAAQEVARMTALLDQAQIQLQKFTILAPSAGTVLVLTVDPGQSVDPSTVLMTIADLEHLLVETDVDESYASQIRLGQPAALQLSGEAMVRDGHVSFVSRNVDETTGGLAIRLTPEIAVTAPIGLTVTANITVDEQQAAISVPRAAIVGDARGDAVFVVKDGVARHIAVVVIDWPAARLIVTEGLDAGDIVIADATGLADGQFVAVAP